MALSTVPSKNKMINNLLDSPYLPLLLFTSSQLILSLTILALALAIRKYTQLRQESARLANQEKARLAQVFATLTKDLTQFSQTLKLSLKNDFDRLFQNEKNQYHLTLKQGRQEISQVFQNMSQELNQVTKAEADNLKSLVQKVITDFKDEYRQAMAKAKEESLAKLRLSIFTLVSQVIADVLGKTLTVSDHEELVIKSLEEAKKEHVL